MSKIRLCSTICSYIKLDFTYLIMTSCVTAVFTLWWFSTVCFNKVKDFGRPTSGS